MMDNVETFYVVTKASADDKEYTSAVAFNSTHKDSDNEAAANEYRDAAAASAPWFSHSVLSTKDFEKASKASVSATDEH
jgi:hypothetical protein